MPSDYQKEVWRRTHTEKKAEEKREKKERKVRMANSKSTPSQKSQLLIEHIN